MSSAASKRTSTGNRIVSEVQGGIPPTENERTSTMSAAKNTIASRIAIACLVMLIMAISMACLAGCTGGQGGSSSESATNGAGGNTPVDSQNQSGASIIVVASCSGQAFEVPQSALAYPQSSIEGERYTGYIVADGTPTLKGTTYEFTRNSESGKAKQAKSFLADYTGACTTAIADSEEVDLLGALNIAVGDVKAHDTSDAVVCVISSGISTSGALVTSPEVLAADANHVVEQLKRNGSIGDYQGVEVRFYGIGCSTGDQEIPDSVAKSLKGLWGEIVEAGDGTAVFCGDAVAHLGNDDSLPNVRIFNFPPDRLDVFVGETREIVMDSTVLEFQGDSDEFADPARAKDRLKTYAEDIAANGLKVSIAGYTADSPSRSAEFLQDLSLARARRVADTLIAYGIDPSAIVEVEGYGSKGSMSMASGSFDEAQAQLDRRVVLTITK